MKKILLVAAILVGVILLVCYIAYQKSIVEISLIPQQEYETIEPVTYEPDPIDLRPTILKKYFESKNMPMASYADLFVTAADTFGIDWRLLPAISVRESSGGKEDCGFNPFGWDSCNGYNFKSYEEAITYVSWRLGESPIYAGKTDYEKLQLYNPPTIVEFYADQVLAIMQMIQKDE